MLEKLWNVALAGVFCSGGVIMMCAAAELLGWWSGDHSGAVAVHRFTLGTLLSSGAALLLLYGAGFLCRLWS